MNKLVVGHLMLEVLTYTLNQINVQSKLDFHLSNQMKPMIFVGLLREQTVQVIAIQAGNETLISDTLNVYVDTRCRWICSI